MTTDDEYRTMAKDQYHIDGEIEIPVDACVSRTDSEILEEGAYVSAWVWVYKPESKKDDVS